MHTVEHIGLGRYGDPIDAEGDIKAMKELQRVTKKGGSLLFVVPVGKPKVMFNAHRIYSYESIAKTFDMMKVEEFTLIPDNHKKGLVINASPKLVAKQDYAAGCFWFIKK
jgi:hypothetical protein